MAQEAPEVPAEEQAPEAAPESSEPKGKKFDEDYVKSLRGEAAEKRKRIQELEARVAEFESAGQSEIEKLTGKVTKAEQRAAEAEAKLLRFEVAAEKQVPAEAMDLLVGSTREELEAKADKLLGLVKPATPEPEAPEFEGGVREPSPDPKTPEQEHNEVALGLLGLAPRST